MNSLVKGTVFGAIVLFVWGMISWTVIPWHGTTMMAFQNEEQVISVLKENAPVAGLYSVPAPSNWKEMTPDHPFVYAQIAPNGLQEGMGPMMAKAVLIQLLGAFLVTMLLLKTKGLDFTGKVIFVTVAGFFAAAVSQLPMWNWFGFSTVRTLVMIADITIGYLLAGLVIARVTKDN